MKGTTMKKTLVLAMAGLALWFGDTRAWAVDLTKTLVVEMDTDKTSKDIDVKFQLQRANWSGENLTLFGKVSNETQKNYQYVQVILTVYDKEGNFVTRSTTGIYPDVLGSMKVGYMDADYIETGELIPSRVTIKVTGELDDGNGF
jgi:hypothetical protein